MTQSPKINDSKDTDTKAIESCLDVLNQLCERPELCAAPQSSYADVANKASLLMRRLKQLRKEETTRRDRETLADAGIREQRRRKEGGRFVQGNVDGAAAVSLGGDRKCYVCKQVYRELHSFYDALCPKCGEESLAKRSQTADLAGHGAVVTGGRMKIGFQTSLKLLRAGAQVFITTRFPCDAVSRYEQELDFAAWRDRLCIFGCDFRAASAVEQLCDAITGEFPHVDILINNAAQTIRRPVAYYHPLLQRERELAITLSQQSRGLLRGSVNTPGSTSLLAVDRENSTYFPVGQVDQDGQQIDQRPSNSWVLRLGDVSLAELLEVHAVSSLTPFMLIQRLEPLLLSSPRASKYIVNVSAMEGRFAGTVKPGLHVHTNMAKAGLNMITRTCADHFASRGIYMNSVDTGWVTNEFPFTKTESMRNDGFEPPLDEIDGAARVCDPIFRGENDADCGYGQFLKDYRSIRW